MGTSMLARRHSATRQQLRDNRQHAVINGTLFTPDMQIVANLLGQERNHNHLSSMPNSQQQPGSSQGTAPVPSSHTSPVTHDHADIRSAPPMRRGENGIATATYPRPDGRYSVYELRASRLVASQEPPSPLPRRVSITPDNETEIFEAPWSLLHLEDRDEEQMPDRGSMVFDTEYQLSVGPFTSLRAMSWWREGVEVDLWESMFGDESSD